jgi:hypothetical protein
MALSQNEKQLSSKADIKITFNPQTAELQGIFIEGRKIQRGEKGLAYTQHSPFC